MVQLLDALVRRRRIAERVQEPVECPRPRFAGAEGDSKAMVGQDLVGVLVNFNHMLSWTMLAGDERQLGVFEYRQYRHGGWSLLAAEAPVSLMGIDRCRAAWDG